MKNECEIFHFFQKCLSDEVGIGFEESKSEPRKGLILEFAGGNILEIGFEANLKWKRNVLSF